MHCKHCLAPLSAEDTYCKVCGNPVERKENYPSNEEIIRAYNNENMHPKMERERFENREEKRNTISSSTNVETRKEEYIQAMRKEQELLQSPASMPQHEPILTPPEPTTPRKIEEPIARPSIEDEMEERTNQRFTKKAFALGILIAMIATALITTLICIPVLSKTETTLEPSSEQKNETKTVIENRVLFSGYSFLIPEGYSYKLNGTQFIVEKIDTKEAMSLQVGTGTYDNLKTNLNPLKTSLTNAKWVVGKLYVDQVVKGRNYLTVEANFNTQKVMLAYTTADETQIFGMVYLNPTATTYPSETIEVFADIIDSALKVNNPMTTTIADFTKNKLIFTASELSKIEKTATNDTKGQATTTNNQTGTTSTNKTNATSIHN